MLPCIVEDIWLSGFNNGLLIQYGTYNSESSRTLFITYTKIPVIITTLYHTSGALSVCVSDKSISSFKVWKQQNVGGHWISIGV